MDSSAIPSHLMNNFDVDHKPLIYQYKKYVHQGANGKSSSLVNICTEAIDLDGMQKEAFISSGRNSSGWRIPTDESLHLRGADAAPQPLAIHNASVQMCLLNQIKKILADKKISNTKIEVTVDTYFNIKGSFYRGDIKSCLKDIVVKFDIDADIPEVELKQCVLEALLNSPTIRAIRYPMNNTFSIRANGRNIHLPPEMQSGLERVGDPLQRIHDTQKLPPLEGAGGLILEKKLESTMEPPKPGEIPVGLLPEIDRTVHIRGIGQSLNQYQNEVQTSFYHPLGSVFCYRSDLHSEDIAGLDSPSALSYHGAALAFCFMTQFHRYADVHKIHLDALRIVQLTPFDLDIKKHQNLVFDTHIFVDGDFSDEVGTDLVRLAHQVCFLHAALETQNDIHYSITLNDQEVVYQQTLTN